MSATMEATDRAEAAPRVAGRVRAAWDSWLVGSVTALVVIGLVMVQSASVAYAARLTGDPFHFLFRHVVHLMLGLLCLSVTLRLRIRLWEKGGPYLLLGGFFLLALVLVPGLGAHINGSSRWIRLGLMNLQPSEVMKLFIVVYVAGYLVRKQEELRNFTQGIVMVSVVLAVIALLLLLEPDLGTVIVITLTVLTMLFLGGVRFWHFLLVTLTGVGAVALLAVIAPYRWARVTSFLNPWADPFNTGFQLVQALIAFGRGEWFGVGLGASVQKLFYLPAAHTDFVLAVIGEELGLFAVLGIIVLFGVVIVRAFLIARKAERAGQLYASRLAQGLGLLIGYQAIINMGVNMGLLPTKGLTLPLVSYGGSSTLVSLVAVGLLLRIEREARGLDSRPAPKVVFP
jgi:cell division protein FtsW